ncbi:MAG: ParA family protein [Gammaproteobacteria bacterium]|jgi:chromosome partitioning protein|nr:cobyrinic acid ac-diamide synthase [Chromatiales bacterium]MDP6675793.1 ParA family protein [Gammaproteobacteria bacterium]
MLLKAPSRPDLKRIVVINPKGGSGKSTVASNIAGFLSASGHPVALMDFDPQGSALRWMQNRSDKRPEVYGISACEHDTTMTRSFQMRVPLHIKYLVIDTPAALQAPDLAEFTRGAHAILVPALPSDIDIYAAARFVSDLLVVAKVSRRMGRLGVVANRVRENTLSYRKLKRFLERLSISVVGELRDSQNYVFAAEQGLSIHEMQPSRVSKDLDSWKSVTNWLEDQLETELTPRDLLKPKKDLPAGPATPEQTDKSAVRPKYTDTVRFPGSAGRSPATPRTPGFEPPLPGTTRDPAK